MDFITRKCRRGTFSFLETDTFVGRSINDYGEYGEGELELFEQVLRPGDVAMDVGANIGSLTVPMAQMVGPTGKVYAWEPGGNNLPVLRQNLAQNGLLDRVEVMPFAASNKAGDVEVAQVASLHLWRRPEPEFMLYGDPVKAPTRTIDSLNLPKLKFLKIDVDGMELEVIDGMDATIKRCRPYIYIENEQKGQQELLIKALTDRGYRLWWHRPYQFNPNNFNKHQRNWFGNIVSIMMFAAPEEAGNICEGLEEVADIRDDDDMFEREAWRYERYSKRHPEDLWARLMLAHNLNLMQHSDEADALIEENLRRDPEHVATKSLKALMALQRGDFAAGWKGAQLRFKQPVLRQFGGHRYAPFNQQAPQWQGEITDAPLLIWSEQGFGDMMMFARFLPMVMERAPNIYLECHDALFELFEYSEIVPKGRLLRLHRKLPTFDYQISLPSLPSVLDPTADDIRRLSKPYLRVDPTLVEHWHENTFQRPIGICHRGSPRSERPLTRDCPPEQFDKLMFDFGPFFHLHHNGQFENFMDTGAAMQMLDLIITVDTSVAHLAGALGRDVWLMLSTDPDWRWGLKGDRSIWYPSMRIFRQPKFRDWSAVIEDMRAALHERRQQMREAAE